MNRNNPSSVLLFFSTMPAALNNNTPDVKIPPQDNYDRDSIGSNDLNDRRLERILERLTETINRQEVRNPPEKCNDDTLLTTLIEKLTLSVRPSVDRSSLPKFNRSPEEEIIEFLLQFKRVATFNNWNSHDQLCGFPQCLNQSASTYYESQPDKTKKHIDSLIKAFQNEYEPLERVWIKKTQLYSFKEGLCGLEKFIAKLEKLCQELSISKETKLDLFIQGVNPNL